MEAPLVYNVPQYLFNACIALNKHNTSSEGSIPFCGELILVVYVVGLIRGSFSTRKGCSGLIRSGAFPSVHSSSVAFRLLCFAPLPFFPPGVPTDDFGWSVARTEIARTIRKNPLPKFPYR